MSPRVYCLYRVSTIKQVDRDEANQADIPMQRKACRDFAGKMGWSIIREEQEAGVSGFKVSAEHRDKLQLIKEHAQKGKFDILLVFMFDRLGRKADETPFVVEWFVKNGIQVWSVNEGEQRFESHIDRLTNYIRFWQADGESQKTSIRTKVALGQLVEEGRFRGGSVPYGYRLEKSGVFNKRKHEVSKLVIDAEEAKVVQVMFNLCVQQGYGRNKIANMISAQGLKTRTGGNWHEATVGHILHNITYIGILRSGETKSEIIPELQIIDPHTFAHAQDIMTQRINQHKKKRTAPLNTSGQSLLSGNVFCGHCGGRLVLTTSGKTARRADGTPVHTKRIRYVCYNKTRHRVECNGQTGYTMHILDGIVGEVIKSALDRFPIIEKAELISQLRIQAQSEIQEKLHKELVRLKDAQAEYSKLKSEIRKSLLGTTDFPAYLLAQIAQEAQDNLQAIERRVAMLRSELSLSKIKADSIMEEFHRFKWSQLFELCNMPAKKMVAYHLIHKVKVFQDYSLAIEGSNLLLPAR